MTDLRARHRIHVRETGEDLPLVRDWTWSVSPAPIP
jgi:hypothetical protein